jgi:hypothetical protein
LAAIESQTLEAACAIGQAALFLEKLVSNFCLILAVFRRENSIFFTLSAKNPIFHDCFLAGFAHSAHWSYQ